MGEHRGNCHCGRTRIVLRETSEEATECHCSICRRTAGLWHYSPMHAVTVAGEGVAYRQGDRALDLWHCAVCGCTTHWTPTDPDQARMGVNLRMFDPALWSDLPRRLVDGASF